MSNSINLINEYLEESLQLAKEQRNLSEIINEISIEAIKTIELGGKVIFMGNGGSASDSLHLSAEIVGKFQKERMGLPAISLSSNIAIITALANDFGYENIFVKQLEAVAKKNDLIIGITTSGESENIILGLRYAKQNNIKTVGFVGQDSKKIDDYCDYVLNVPSDKASMIQQAHITLGQLMCLLIEEHFFSS